jgi:hypothetical protein
VPAFLAELLLMLRRSAVAENAATWAAGRADAFRLDRRLL